MNQVWMLVWFEMRRFIGRRRWLVWVVAALPFLSLLSVLYAVYQVAQQVDIAGRDRAFADLGVVMLNFEMYAALLITLVGVPALAANTFAGEREKGTLETLFLTRLTSWQIVAAKLLLAMTPTLVGLFILLPVAPAVVLLGGAGVSEVLLDIGELLVAAVFIVTAGFCCSTLFRRSIIASSITYMLAGLLVAWPLILMYFMGSTLLYDLHDQATDVLVGLFIALYGMAALGLIADLIVTALKRYMGHHTVHIRIALACLVIVSIVACVLLIDRYISPTNQRPLDDYLRAGIAAAGTPLASLLVINELTYSILTPHEQFNIALVNVLGEVALAAALFRVATWRVEKLRRTT